jgi:hypothetical protein
MKERETGAWRNANPTPEAIMATALYLAEFRDFEGGPADFWDALPPERQREAETWAERMIQAWKRRQPKKSGRKR